MSVITAPLALFPLSSHSPFLLIYTVCKNERESACPWPPPYGGKGAPSFVFSRLTFLSIKVSICAPVALALLFPVDSYVTAMSRRDLSFILYPKSTILDLRRSWSHAHPLCSLARAIACAFTSFEVRFLLLLLSRAPFGAEKQRCGNQSSEMMNTIILCEDDGTGCRAFPTPWLV